MLFVLCHSDGCPLVHGVNLTAQVARKVYHLVLALLCFCLPLPRGTWGYWGHLWLFSCHISYISSYIWSSSQLVLNSTTLCSILFRHWNGPCEPMCRKTILKSNPTSGPSGSSSELLSFSIMARNVAAALVAGSLYMLRRQPWQPVIFLMNHSMTPIGFHFIFRYQRTYFGNQHVCRFINWWVIRKNIRFCCWKS